MSGLSIIDNNAEEIMFAFFKAQSQITSGEVDDTQFLQCRFFQIGLAPDAASIVILLDSIQFDDNAKIYQCKDGDIFIAYEGSAAGVGRRIQDCVLEKYGSQINQYLKLEEFFSHYDLVGYRDKLDLELKKKLKKQTKQSKELALLLKDESVITTFGKTIKLTQTQRSARKRPHILIVEDQVFSQKLLTSILKDYTCYTAESSADAVLLYMEKCPDIIFLDVELPDISGHSVAGFINRIDESAYVVMVTANKYNEDIKKARENRVKGYVAKPFAKDVILEKIEEFQKVNKRRRCA